MVPHALYQDLEVLADVLVGDRSRNYGFLRGKQNRDLLLKDMSTQKMEIEELGKMLLEKRVAIKLMIRSAVDLKRTVHRLKTEKNLLMRTNDELLSCPSQTNTSGC